MTFPKPLSGWGQDRGTIINFNKMKDGVEAKGEGKSLEWETGLQRAFSSSNKSVRKGTFCCLIPRQQPFSPPNYKGFRRLVCPVPVNKAEAERAGEGTGAAPAGCWRVSGGCFAQANGNYYRMAPESSRGLPSNQLLPLLAPRRK